MPGWACNVPPTAVVAARGDPAMRILGVDLGQSKSAWEMLDTQTGSVVNGWVGMDSAQLLKLLQRQRPELVVFESGPLAARVHDLVVDAGVAVQVADTTQDAWQWRNVKRKTDADDAHKLARLAALGQINPVHIPAPAVREWRHLLEYRQALVAEQTRCKNRIRSTLLLQGLRLPGGKKGWALKVREELRAQTQPLAECAPAELWRGLLATELEHLAQVEVLVTQVADRLDALAAASPAAKRLRGIKGIGAVVAGAVVTVLDQPRRFATRRQVSAYVGLVPRRYQSGQMDRSGRISKRGSKLLRGLVNQSAWAVLRWNPELRAFFLRVGGGQKKRRKQAVVALMRKLVVVCWAMLRDGSVYQAARLRAPELAQPAA